MKGKLGIERENGNWKLKGNAGRIKSYVIKTYKYLDWTDGKHDIVLGCRRVQYYNWRLGRSGSGLEICLTVNSLTSVNVRLALSMHA